MRAPVFTAASDNGGKSRSEAKDSSDPLQWVFDNEHIIGNGSFGVVYQAAVRGTGRVCGAALAHVHTALLTHR